MNQSICTVADAKSTVASQQSVQTIERALRRGLRWAEQRDFTGYSKFDALNSRFLSAVTGGHSLLRKAVVYLVSRAPMNIRPLLGVAKSLNPNALALFARTYFNLHTSVGDTGALGKGLTLLERLLELSQIEHYASHCWGVGHPVQSTKGYNQRNCPYAVITVEVAEAFIDAYLRTGDASHLKVALSAVRFLTSVLPVLEDSERGVCYGYDPQANWKCINSNAKAAGTIARVAAITQDSGLARTSEAIMRWVVSLQTENGAWYYAEPPDASHVKHDNYHTGFVLDSLLEYMLATGCVDWMAAYEKGLQFYQRELFCRNGAPKWRSYRTYPHDIMGAAQGVLTFTLGAEFYADGLEVAEKVSQWTLLNMAGSRGQFYYQKGRFWTKKYTLMRWCQAWMCYALSVLLPKQILKHTERGEPLS